MASQVKLGQILVKTGLLTEAEVLALQAAQEADDTLAETVVRRSAITESQIAEAVATYYGLPYIDLRSTSFSSEALSLFTEAQAKRFGAIPVRLEPDGSVLLAVSDPVDYAAKQALEFRGLRARLVVASPAAIREAIAAEYRTEDTLEDIVKQISESRELDEIEVAVQQQPDEPQGVLDLHKHESRPVVKTVNAVIRDGIATRASDIHIEPAQAHVRVRYRIDGVLNEALRLPKWVQNVMVARLKVLANLDIAERRVPQDGRFRLRMKRSEIDVRVSTLPTHHGEKVVMRLLNPDENVSKLHALGFAPPALAAIRGAIQQPQGTILVTGPTGSGKSSTLFGSLREIANRPLNIVTVENPIEYELAGITQVQINEKQGLTFASVLRSILRQDPNVILVGEIRDRETAEIAFQAAMTGHLVLSTLHTNDAPSAVSRLFDLAVPAYLVGSSLSLVVAQRLVRRICEACKQPATPDPAQLAKLGLDPHCAYFEGAGCMRCAGTGYIGRTVVSEVLPVDARIRALIAARAPEGAIRKAMRAAELPSILEDAARKVRLGETTAEEVLRVVELQAGQCTCPRCGEGIESDYAACPHCATTLRILCTACREPLKAGWAICPYCRTAAPAAAAAPPPRLVAPAPAPAPAADAVADALAWMDDVSKASPPAQAA
ncbi:MAG TPA: ATPase, T2SS/T4P/T4SS family [Planctomycetota bacterium]|nr:ATPase, T2SS/T4P/T4SS family [Planctomycetota bacterium]